MMTGRQVYRYKGRFWGTAADKFLTDSAVAAIESAWLTEVLPTHLGFFEKMLSDSATPWLAGTSSPTIADLMVGTQLKMLSQFHQLSPPLDAFVKSVYALPAVVAWREQEAAAKK